MNKYWSTIKFITLWFIYKIMYYSLYQGFISSSKSDLELMKEYFAVALPLVYFTMFIAIFSLSAITYTIYLGVAQILLRKNKYRKYEHDLLTDKTPIMISRFLTVYSIGFLVMYIFKDFSKDISTTIAFPVDTIILICIILLHLYRYLISQYDLYIILERKYCEVIEKGELLIERNRRFPYNNQINDKNKKQFAKEIEEFEDAINLTLAEYKGIVLCAIDNNDIELYEEVCKKTSDVVSYWIENMDMVMDSNCKNKCKYESYIDKIFNIYFEYLNSNASQNMIGCSNKGFVKVFIIIANSSGCEIESYMMSKLNNLTIEQLEMNHPASMKFYHDNLKQIINLIDDKLSNETKVNIINNVAYILANFKLSKNNSKYLNEILKITRGARS